MRELKISLEEQRMLMRHEDIRTTLGYGGRRFKSYPRNQSGKPHAWGGVLLSVTYTTQYPIPDKIVRPSNCPISHSPIHLGDKSCRCLGCRSLKVRTTAGTRKITEPITHITTAPALWSERGEMWNAFGSLK
jgi:hypothetical protein